MNAEHYSNKSNQIKKIPDSILCQNQNLEYINSNNKFSNKNSVRQKPLKKLRNGIAEYNSDTLVSNVQVNQIEKINSINTSLNNYIKKSNLPNFNLSLKKNEEKIHKMQEQKFHRNDFIEDLNEVEDEIISENSFQKSKEEMNFIIGLK